METTMDRSGRLVLPSQARRQLGLVGGERLEVEVRDGLVELRLAPTPMTLHETEDGPVAVPDGPLPPLSADAVRESLEASRR